MFTFFNLSIFFRNSKYNFFCSLSMFQLLSYTTKQVLRNKLHTLVRHHNKSAVLETSIIGALTNFDLFEAFILDLCCFWEKFLLWRKQVIFRFKINTLELFSKCVHLVFMKLYPMTVIKNWFKLTDLNFNRKFLLCPKLGEMGHFWAPTYICSLALFWNYT